MDHRPYIREVPGSKKAVLMIHGICGTPRHFDIFLPYIPQDWSVYNILLDGHGGSVDDFPRSSMEKWRNQVADQLDALYQYYDQIILVAHSMGCLFCLQEAVTRPEKIRAMFLLQVPLRPRLKLRYGFYSVLLTFGIVPKSAVDMSRGSSLTLTPLLWKYLGWLPRFLELFAESRRTRCVLPHVAVPCRIYQSARDEMVSTRSLVDLQSNSLLEISVLPESGHFGYHGADLQKLQADFASLFQ